MTGIATSTALIAGCGAPESGPDNDSNEAEGTNGVNESADEADNETNDSTDGEDNETDGDNETDEGTDGGEWQDVEEIVLDGHTEAWGGVEPAPIEEEDNPTLVLFAGQEYSITWENADGAPHNIAIWDENEEALESTEIIDEEGETQTLEFEATEEMAQYVCEVHPNTMIGDLEVHTKDGERDGADNETNDSADGEDNETDE